MKDIDTKKSYYAIIPANVRYDERLIPNAKLLYGEITALCNEKGYCWASNDYFAGLYSVSKTSIKKWLKSLEDAGYISRRVKYKEGSKEIENRWITIITHPGQEKLPTPGQEKCPDNNTSFNNTSNIVHSSAQLNEDFEKLWNLYPNKQGKKKAHTAYCKAIKEGATNKQIQDGIVKYKKHLTANDWLKPANGSTWFNNERWNDEYGLPPEQQSKKYLNYDEFMKGAFGDGNNGT